MSVHERAKVGGCAILRAKDEPGKDIVVFGKLEIVGSYLRNEEVFKPGCTYNRILYLLKHKFSTRYQLVQNRKVT